MQPLLGLNHSIAPAAETTTFTNFAPRLQDGPTQAGATGRTNVFMNGVEGPGPMGFQPSVFDFAAGDAAWSPYWDHFAYRWTDASVPTLVTPPRPSCSGHGTQASWRSSPGCPTPTAPCSRVNCPVPVLAPNDFTPG